MVGYMRRDGTERPTRFVCIATYIMASARNGFLYVGSTNDLPRRAFEHREQALDGFSADHGCTQLVWFELHDLMTEAIRRERRIKHWSRAWKVALIERDNPEWLDLYATLA